MRLNRNVSVFLRAARVAHFATVDRDVPVGTVDDWRWAGPTASFTTVCDGLGVPALAERVSAVAASRS